MKKEKIQQALEMIVLLAEDYGLIDWNVKVTGMRVAVAETHHREKAFYFSKYFLMKCSKKELENATLHEFAHALLGPGYGHGSKFIDMCNKLSGEYIADSVQADIGKYWFTCNKCGQHRTTNRMNDKLACGICYRKDETISLPVYTKNKIEVLAW